MSMTTPMSCSISAIVVPNSWFVSRMKRHMSSFSSRFIPTMGSSSSSMAGSIGKAADGDSPDLLDFKKIDDVLDHAPMRDFLGHRRPVAQQLPPETASHMD